MLYMLHEHAHIIWEVSLAHAEHTHILCTCIYTYVHACMHTYIHTHTHTHTHTHNFLLYVKKNENARVGVADTMKERFSTFFHALPRGAVLGFFFIFFHSKWYKMFGTILRCLYRHMYMYIYIYIYYLCIYIYYLCICILHFFLFVYLDTKLRCLHIYIIFIIIIIIIIYIYIKIVCV